MTHHASTSAQSGRSSAVRASTMSNAGLRAFRPSRINFALLDPSVKKWLRDPQDVTLLMDAIIQGYFNRLKPKNTSKKTNWGHIGDSGDSLKTNLKSKKKSSPQRVNEERRGSSGRLILKVKKK